MRAKRRWTKAELDATIGRLYWPTAKQVAAAAARTGAQKSGPPAVLAAAPRKYHNRPAGGYASERERDRSAELALLVRGGLIFDLREQVRFELIPAQYGPEGRLIERSLSYVADFAYWDYRAAARVVEDVKGMRTRAYVIKRKLMLFVHNIVIVEV